MSNYDQLDELMDRGVNLKNERKYEEAIPFFEQVIALNRDKEYVALAWFCKGDCLSALYKSEEADPCLINAINMQPRFALAWGSRASALKSMERFPEAKIAIEQYLTLVYSGNIFPKEWPIGEESIEFKREQLVEINNRLKQAEADAVLQDFYTIKEDEQRFEEALAILDRAIEIAPAYDHPYNWKIDLLEMKGRKEEALACVDKFLPNVTESGDFGWYEKRGRLCRELGRLEDANRALDKSITMVLERIGGFAKGGDFWSEMWPFWEKGILLSEMGDFTEALRHFGKAIEFYPKVLFESHLSEHFFNALTEGNQKEGYHNLQLSWEWSPKQSQ